MVKPRNTYGLNQELLTKTYLTNRPAELSEKAGLESFFESDIFYHLTKKLWTVI
jgi:hypothetical protein